MVYAPFLAGQRITADLLNTRLIEITMDWTDFDDIGVYATNFSSSGSNTPQLRKILFMGAERWEYRGRIQIASNALATNTDTTAFTFNSGYRPTLEHGWQLTGASTDFFGIRTTLQTSGALRFGIPTEAVNSTSAVFLDGAFLDATI